MAKALFASAAVDLAPSSSWTSRAQVGLALAALYVIWGSTYYAIRVSLESFPPLLMGGARFVVAGAMLYATLRLRGAAAPATREWAASALVGALLLLCGNGLVIYAEQTTGSGVVALVLATTPLWTAVFARAFGTRLGAGEWGGLLVGFGGAALLNVGGDLGAGGPAATVLLVSPIAWALGSTWSARLPMPKGAMAAAAQMLTGGALMLVAGVLRGEHMPEHASTRSVLAVAYLVVFGSLVGFSAYGFLLRTTSTAVATSYAYVNPVVALAIGALFAGEPLAPLTIVAAAIIIAGVGLVSLSRWRDQVRPARR